MTIPSLFIPAWIIKTVFVAGGLLAVVLLLGSVALLFAAWLQYDKRKHNM